VALIPNQNADPDFHFISKHKGRTICDGLSEKSYFLTITNTLQRFSCRRAETAQIWSDCHTTLFEGEVSHEISQWALADRRSETRERFFSQHSDEPEQRLTSFYKLQLDDSRRARDA
jgi:hypothetical protein